MLFDYFCRNKFTMQKVKHLLLYLTIIIICSAQKPASTTEHIKWISLDEAVANMQKEKRPLLIDLYTDWCGWCKVMDKKTYSNKNVADYVGDKFYAVRINAETHDKITWNNKTYSFNTGYRSNEFAVYLTNGRLEFPTTIFIPADGSGPQAIPGYMAPKDFELPVKYFGDGGYGKIPFEEYQKSFKPSW
jgi:thioredoxin-related protein